MDKFNETQRGTNMDKFQIIQGNKKQSKDEEIQEKITKNATPEKIEEAELYGRYMVGDVDKNPFIAKRQQQTYDDFVQSIQKLEESVLEEIKRENTKRRQKNKRMS